MSSRPEPPRDPGGAARAAAVRSPKKPAGEADDDDEIALPPFDDEDEDDESQLDVGDLLSSLEDEDADPFDDSTAADLETGLDIGLTDDGEHGGDEAAEEGVDVGGLDDDLLVQEDGLGGLDERLETGLEEDEDLASWAKEGSDDDGGAEGTVSSGEDDVSEEDLPELDADEEGDHEADDVVAEMTFAADTSLPPWDAQRFAPVDGAGAAVPCSALAVARGKVAAAGEVVLLVDEEAHAARRSGFEAGARSVAIADDGAIVAAARGELWISQDGGKTASALGGWRGNTNAAVLVAAPGRIWILSDGALSWIATSGGASTQVRGEGVVRIAATGAGVIALSRAAMGPVLERFGGGDEGAQALPAGDAASRAAEEDERVLLAAAGGGRLLALASSEAVCVSRDGGTSFRAFALPGAAALTFAGDQDDAPLLALLVPPLEDAAYMALVPAEGSPTLVAEVGGNSSVEESPEDGTASIGTAAIGWDASREVVWIACRVGLLALARARKH